MTCREVLRHLALHLGKDSCEPDSLEEVRQHLKQCPSCRQRSRQIKSSLEVLEQSVVPASFEVAGSLWPSLESQIREPRAVRTSSSLITVRRLIPAATIAAACLLLVTAINSVIPKPAENAPMSEFQVRDMGTIPGLSRPSPPEKRRNSAPDSNRPRNAAEQR